MIEKLNAKGLNLSSIARDAKIEPTRLYSAIKDYGTRNKTVLSAAEERRVYTVLKKIHKELAKSIKDFDSLWYF